MTLKSFIGIIVTAGREVLVIDYNNKEYLVEDTRLPGGSALSCEDYEEALWRKLLEETGLCKRQVTNPQKVYVTKNHKRGFEKIFFHFVLNDNPCFLTLRKHFTETSSGAELSPPYFANITEVMDGMPYHYRRALEGIL